MLTDKYGPRHVYACILALASIPCFMFALADDFMDAAIARFLLGFVGAGFVVGIRMVSEWFPANELGTAEGIYGGWGNFGSAAGAMLLPGMAILLGLIEFTNLEGWRIAVLLSGFISLCFSVIWYLNVTNTPKGATYYKPKKSAVWKSPA